MKYLDSVELLNLALDTLRYGQRAQVPLSKLQETHLLIASCMRRTPDVPLVQMLCADLLQAIHVAQSNKAVRYLSQNVRDALANGIARALTTISDEAWEYYMSHDVPIADQTIPLLRIIVQYHFAKEDV